MALGIRNFFTLAADQAVTASVVLVTMTGFTIPVVAGRIYTIKTDLQFSVGAAGGVRIRWTLPTLTRYAQSILLANTVAPAVVVAEQVANADFTNALANAGNHFFRGCVCFVPSASGNALLQFAQNTSDATPVTMLAGSSADLTIL